MFRNLIIFRLPNGISATPEQLAAQLEKGIFVPCTPNATSSSGWVEPHPGVGLVFSQERQRLLCLQTEDKILPSSYVTRCAQAKAEELAEQQGYAVGRKQMRELKERIVDELLPRAFTKLTKTLVWIDNANGWLAIDGTANRCDDVIQNLKRCMDMLPQIAVPQTVVSPGSAMTGWLAAGEAPDGLTVDRECELQDISEERASVRYVHHDLDIRDIREHIAQGKSATKLAMTWNDRVSFVLTNKMEIKRIALLDIITEQAEQDIEVAADKFAADFVLATGELSRLIADVVDACGGEVPDIDEPPATTNE